MHLTEENIMVGIQAIGTVLVALLASYFKTQLALVKSEQATHILELEAKIIQRIDSVVLDRQTLMAGLKDVMSDRVDHRLSAIAGGFVSIPICELMHKQESEKYVELNKRIDHLEGKIEEVNGKIDSMIASGG